MEKIPPEYFITMIDGYYIFRTHTPIIAGKQLPLQTPAQTKAKTYSADRGLIHSCTQSQALFVFICMYYVKNNNAQCINI